MAHSAPEPTNARRHSAYAPAGVTVSARTTSPESFGTYCFPPIASVTAGARLMLTLAQTDRARLGGSCGHTS